MTFDRATGQPVEHFGDRTSAPVLAETLWDRVHAARGRTAAICWPKTRVVAVIPDNIPEFYEQELFEQYASRPLWTELAQRRLPVDRYGPWSKAHPLGPMQDWLTLEAARHVLAVRPPRLLLLHFLTLDSFQHDYGVDSAEARWALIEMDAPSAGCSTLLELGRAESTTLLVFGDHGFAEVRHTHHSTTSLREEGLRRGCGRAGHASARLGRGQRRRRPRVRARRAPRGRWTGCASALESAIPGVEVIARALRRPRTAGAGRQPHAGRLVLAAEDGASSSPGMRPRRRAASRPRLPCRPRTPAAPPATGRGLPRRGSGCAPVPDRPMRWRRRPRASSMVLPGAEGAPLLEAPRRVAPPAITRSSPAWTASSSPCTSAGGTRRQAGSVRAATIPSCRRCAGCGTSQYVSSHHPVAETLRCCAGSPTTG